MNLQQIKYFVAIAESGSFRKAAEQLYVAQPALSYGISSLESEMNTKLFERGKRKCTLTKSGEVLLEEAKIILQHVDMAYQRVEAVNNTDNKKLHICCLGFLTTLCFQEIISPFLAIHPEINVILEQDYLKPINQKLEKKDADVIITRSDTFDIGKNFSCEQRLLYHDEFYLVVSGKHPLASLSSIDDMSILADEPFLTLDKNLAKEFYDKVCDICRRKNYTPKVVSTSPVIDILYTQVSAQMGISVLPMFNRYFDANLDLKYIQIENEENISNDVVAIWDSSNQNPHLEKFIAFIKNMNSPHPCK